MPLDPCVRHPGLTAAFCATCLDAREASATFFFVARVADLETALVALRGVARRTYSPRSRARTSSSRTAPWIPRKQNITRAANTVLACRSAPRFLRADVGLQATRRSSRTPVPTSLVSFPSTYGRTERARAAVWTASGNEGEAPQ